MAKTYLSTVKYEVKAKYEITGLVEKPDIVGAIFGQSEGLLGEDMDLKQLQQNGKIGRIEIAVNKGKGKTTGEIIIPSSLDQVKTSILAATMETVEKVGPCEAHVEVVSISDVRKEKRGQITDRAKELLKKMQKFEGVESDALADGIRSDIRIEKAIKYKGMTAGPDVESSKNIIVVEGRADVLKLLSYGINDAIEMNGSNISKELIAICKEKEVTMLVDGDRGGELNAKKLNSLTNVTYVARAPDGKEVEELTQKEILQALKRRLDIKDYLSGKPTNHRHDRNQRTDSRRSYDRNDSRGNYNRDNSRRSYDRNDSRGNYNRDNSRGNYIQKDSRGSHNRSDSPRGYDRNDSRGNYNRDNSRRSYDRNDSRGTTNRRYDDRRHDSPYTKREVVVEKTPAPILALEKDFEKIKGKLKARFYDAKKKKIKDVKVNEMIDAVEKSRKKIDTVIFDGIITKRLLEIAESKGVKNIVGVRKSSASSTKVKTYTM
jgi:DNA primase